MERNAWKQRPVQMCQQTTNAWRMGKWTISKTWSRRDSSPGIFHLHHKECNWSMHSPSQRPGIDFHDSVMVAHAGLDLPAYITTLLFSASLSLCGSVLWLCLFTASQQEEFTVQTFSSSEFFRIIHHPKTPWSCDPYLHKESGPGKRSPCPGCVSVPWVCCAVSSDSRRTSLGNLCTACICPWSLSTSNCHAVSLFLTLYLFLFFLFISLSFTFSCSTSTVTAIFTQKVIILCYFPSLSLSSLLLMSYPIMSFHTSAFFYKLNVALMTEQESIKKHFYHY